MPEDVVDIGVDDFDCRPNHTSGSASDEVEAEMSAGEAHVLTQPSESRNLASEMFYGKELLLACRTLRKDPCQHVWRGSSVYGSRSVMVSIGLGVQSVSVRRWSLNNVQDRWAELLRHLHIECAKPLSVVAADHQFPPATC